MPGSLVGVDDAYPEVPVSMNQQQTRWVQRLIAEERAPAFWILAAAIAGLLFANAAGADVVEHLLTFGPRQMSLERFASEGLLAVFFFVAGLELRHELTIGSLNSARAASVPVLAAALGMVVPALLFVAVGPTAARTAWGVPMATDLPLALALLAFAGRSLPGTFRAFILSLAIVDDALSIAVVAVVFGSGISVPWSLAAVACVIAYAVLIRRSGWLASPVAFAAWFAMVHTGIHPTVIGVVLGLATSRNGDAIRERWQPLSAYVAVPVFIAVSLAIPLDARAMDGHLIASLAVARVLGKPLGIWLGALLAIRLTRPEGVLPGRLYAVAGSVAGVGFSVSALFAGLTLQGEQRVAMLVAVVVALAVAAVVALGVLRTLPATPEDG